MDLDRNNQRRLKSGTAAPTAPAVVRPGRRRLRVVLLLWFLGISLLPVGLVSWLGYRQAQRAQIETITANLTAVTRAKSASLAAGFATSIREIEYQARLDGNVHLLGELITARSVAGGPRRPWAAAPDQPSPVAAAAEPLRRLQIDAGYYDILLADTAGRVLFSCRQGIDPGFNLFRDAEAGTRLGRVWQAACDESRTAFSGFQRHHASAGLPSAFLIRPMSDASGEIQGALVFQFDSHKLGEAVGAGDPPDDVGETYVVDADNRLLTRSARHPWLQILDDRIPTGTAAERVSTSVAGRRLEPVTDCTVSLQMGFDGREMIAVRQPVIVLDEALGVVSVVDRQDALAGTRRMLPAMFGVLLLVVAVVSLAGLVISRRIVAPLVRLGRIMQQLAEGAEVDVIDVGGHNEVGDLADQFALMVDRLGEARRQNEYQYNLKRSQFELNELMRGQIDTQELAASVLRYVADKYDAPVGVFYLALPGQRLVLAAELGIDARYRPMGEMRIGEGVVGEVAERLTPVILQHENGCELRVATGLGTAKPAGLVVAPIHAAGQIKGVIELGVMSHLDQQELEFLKLSNDSIAAALDSARARERVNRLLEETRRQAGELANQQTELRQTNARLERSDRYKSEFLANMSHELRTPLNSMLIMSQILTENRRGNLHESDIEAAGTIHKAGSDLLTIINDILDLSRVEAGKLELHREHLSLPGLAEALDSLFRPVSRDRGLEFRAEHDADLPATIFSDPLRVSQILKNLLNNAFKFTTEGSVVLRIRRPGPGELRDFVAGNPMDWVALSVADTGIGMSQETAGQVFEAFNQGDGSIGRRYGGSGLGLSISRKLAGLLGGRIVVQSSTGQGSTFTLYLPISPIDGTPESDGAPAFPVIRTTTTVLPGPGCTACNAAVSRSEPASIDPAAPRPDLTGQTILLADNDMRTVFSLSEEMDECGAQVVLARDWDECLTAARNRPDISGVLINPRLDQIPAADFGAALREVLSAPTLPVALLVTEPGAAVGNDIDDALIKPVHCDQVAGLLAVRESVNGVTSDG